MTVTADPRRRALGGTSSGVIASWTVAWRHPEAFGNVISFIGSYTSIGLRLGGDIYPALIRKSTIRPLRTFLQDGRNDLDNEHSNWFLANQQMVTALEWSNHQADSIGRAGPRYDIRYVWTDGGIRMSTAAPCYRMSRNGCGKTSARNLERRWKWPRCS